MSYSYNKFLRPLTSSDRNIQIQDDNGIVKWTVEPFSVINAMISNNILKINVLNRVILVPFSSQNEAKLALEKIQLQIDNLRVRTPNDLVNLEIKNYVNNYVTDATIAIPTPQIRLDKPTSDDISEESYWHQSVCAQLLPHINTEYLSYNPKFYIFAHRSKRIHKKRKQGDPKKVTYMGGWHHPTHLNGINFTEGPYYRGNTGIRLKNTETELNINTRPYDLTPLNFNAFDWVYKSVSVGVIDEMTPNDFNVLLLTSARFSGRHNKARSASFCVAIGIENPDTNSPYPIIFGDFSESFRLSFLVQGPEDGKVIQKFKIEHLSSSVKNLYR